MGPARNLELKVRCDADGLDDVRRRAESAGAGPFSLLRQTDTYFRVGRGRLKVREIADGAGSRPAELIGYVRPDENGPRWSDYRRVLLSTDQGKGVRRALEASCGVAAVVRKERSVAIWRRTRVHLDTVEALGCFVELETVVADGDDDAAGAEFAEAVALLGLDRFEPVAGSYGEMIGSA